MKKIVMLIEELGSQMRIHLALCDLYNILFAENIEATMYFLRRAKPDLVLVDFDLKPFREDHQRAIDLIGKIKGKYEDLKVVTILNQAERFAESDVQICGADAVLQRPIETENLIVKLSELTKPGANEVLTRESNLELTVA